MGEHGILERLAHFLHKLATLASSATVQVFYIIKPFLVSVCNGKRGGVCYSLGFVTRTASRELSVSCIHYLGVDRGQIGIRLHRFRCGALFQCSKRSHTLPG